MNSSIVFLLCTLIVFVRGSQLNADIFRNLSSMPMPPASGHSGNIQFHFNTANNVLIEALSENATFAVRTIPGLHRGPPTIDLAIPSEEVVLSGQFSTELHLPFAPSPAMVRGASRTSVFVRRGTYRIYLTRFHLSLSVEYTGSPANPSFELRDCTTVFETIRVEVRLRGGDVPLFGKDFVEDMLQLAAVDEYRELFCKAMRRLLTVPNPVRSAIMSRITSTSSSKSA